MSQTSPTVRNSHEQSLAVNNLNQASQLIAGNTGWAVARLIASSVKVGTPGRPKTHAVHDIPQKVSIKQAEGILGKSQDTIARYLDAWAKASADGLCTPASELTPEDGQTADLPDAADWDRYYNPRRNTPKPPVTTQPEPSVAAQQMTDDETSEFITKAIQANPAHESAARKALDDAYTVRAEKSQAKLQRSKDEAEARRKDDQLHTSLGLIVKLRKVQRDVKELFDAADGIAPLSGDNLDAVAEVLDSVESSLASFRSYLNGTTNWDAALVDLLQEGE